MDMTILPKLSEQSKLTEQLLCPVISFALACSLLVVNHARQIYKFQQARHQLVASVMDLASREHLLLHQFMIKTLMVFTFLECIDLSSGRAITRC